MKQATHFIEVWQDIESGSIQNAEPRKIESLKAAKVYGKKSDWYTAKYFWIIYPRAIAIITSALLLFTTPSCTPTRWVAVPVTVTVTNGVPGYRETGKAMPVSDSMAGGKGFIFKKVKH